MTDDPLDVLRRVVDACAEVGVECAVIGAVARNAWAPPRATTDIDFAISVGAEGYGALVVALDQRGLAVKRTISSEPDAAVPDILLVEAASGIVRRIDLLIAKTPFEREAIAQAVPKDIGAQCRVVRPDHLIVSIFFVSSGSRREFRSSAARSSSASTAVT